MMLVTSLHYYLHFSVIAFNFEWVKWFWYKLLPTVRAEVALTMATLPTLRQMTINSVHIVLLKCRTIDSFKY